MGNQIQDVSHKIGKSNLTVYTWRCGCGRLNHDILELTAIPKCGGCGTEIFWEEILKQEQPEYPEH